MPACDLVCQAYASPGCGGFSQRSARPYSKRSYIPASGFTIRQELLTGGCVNSLSPEFTTRFSGSVTWSQLCRQESASQPTTQRALNAFKFSHGCCVGGRGLSPRWKSLSFHGRGVQEILLAVRHARNPSYVRRGASGISSAESFISVSARNKMPSAAAIKKTPRFETCMLHHRLESNSPKHSDSKPSKEESQCIQGAGASHGIRPGR